MFLASSCLATAPGGAFCFSDGRLGEDKSQSCLEPSHLAFSIFSARHMWCMSQAEPRAAGTASPGDALSRQGDLSWLSVFQQFLVSPVLWIVSLLFPEISRQGELAGPRGAVTGQEGI